VGPEVVSLQGKLRAGQRKDSNASSNARLQAATPAMQTSSHEVLGIGIGQVPSVHHCNAAGGHGALALSLCVANTGVPKSEQKL